jgi:very-short-patch-repair endonuclease
MKKDRERDDYLLSLGFTILRFSDIDALKNVDGVVERIHEHLKSPLPPSLKKRGTQTLNPFYSLLF